MSKRFGSESGDGEQGVVHFSLVHLRTPVNPAATSLDSRGHCTMIAPGWGPIFFMNEGQFVRSYSMPGIMKNIGSETALFPPQSGGSQVKPCLSEYVARP